MPCAVASTPVVERNSKVVESSRSSSRISFVNAGCEKGNFGWPCDAEMEKLRDAFARAPDLAAQKQVADAVQMREREVVTHIWLGQWYQPIAARKSVTPPMSMLSSTLARSCPDPRAVSRNGYRLETTRSIGSAPTRSISSA